MSVKPCPYCGSMNVKVRPVWKTHHFVACADCKSGGPVKQTEAEAIEAYEKRYERKVKTYTKGLLRRCKACNGPLGDSYAYCPTCGGKIV